MKQPFPLKRYLPLIVILLISFVAYTMCLHKYISFESLRKQHDFLKGLVDQHPVLAPICYMVLYSLLVSLSLPVNDILGMAGGFFFDPPWNMVYALIGATSGACVIFLAAKTALNDFLKRRAGSFLKKMEVGFERNALSYLLFIRLIGIFPFWIANIAVALFQVRFWTFLWTTCIGIIPITYVHIELGKGLEKLFTTGEKFSFHALLNTPIKIALIVLALLALLPIFFKKYFRKKH